MSNSLAYVIICVHVFSEKQSIHVVINRSYDVHTSQVSYCINILGAVKVQPENNQKKIQTSNTLQCGIIYNSVLILYSVIIIICELYSQPTYHFLML